MGMGTTVEGSMQSDGHVGRRIRKYFEEWREEKASVAECEQSEKAQ